MTVEPGNHVSWAEAVAVSTEVFLDIEAKRDALAQREADAAGRFDEDPHADRVAEYRRLRAHLGTVHFQYRAVGEDRFDTCAGCNQAGQLVPWPCRTWQMIEDLNPGKDTS